MNKTKKLLVYTIEYKVEASEVIDLTVVMDDLRGNGSVEIVDVRVEDPAPDLLNEIS